MKKSFFTFLLALSINSLTVTNLLAQTDIVYGITENGSSSAVYKFSGVNPTTGANFNSSVWSSTNVSDQGSAALGINFEGTWLYYIEYGSSSTGEGEGKLDIRAIKVDGTGDYQPVNNFDMNGGGNNDELSFVRLGIDRFNKGWIVAKQSDNKLYLASFDADASGGVSNIQRRGTLLTSDNNNDDFENGDLAFDASATMYVLANVTGGVTKIYKISGATLSGTTAGSTNTPLTLTWTLVDNSNNQFSGNVNGVAFSSMGSMYFSGSSGIYFIDATTVNTAGPGTVKCKFLVNNSWDLADLATNYGPDTRLPVSFGDISATISNGQLVVQWQSLTETNCKNYTIEASGDGENWTTIGTISSKANNGYSSGPLNYTYTGAVPMGLAGISLAFLLGILFKSRKVRIIIALVCITSIISCSKSAADKEAIMKSEKVLIRIVNHDVDNNITATSKIVQAKVQ